MKKLVLCVSLLLAVGNVYAADSEIEAYVSSCKKMMLDANPKKDAKDVDMLCRDPYLKGTPNESKEDQARRKRLLGETDKAKESALDKVVGKQTKKSANVSDIPEGMSKSEFDEYLKACKTAMTQAKPKMDKKDITMLCRDPYLKGTPNESKEDQARRQRLLSETNKDKEKVLGQFVTPKKSVDPDLMSKGEYLKECKKLVMEQDPGKDPKDADMLCSDPYLKGKAGESYDDQVRRKRLLKETEEAKEKALDKHVAPAGTKSAEPASAVTK